MEFSNDLNLDSSMNSIKQDIALIKKQVATQGSAVEDIKPIDAKIRTRLAESSDMVNRAIYQAHIDDPSISFNRPFFRAEQLEKFDDPVLGFNPTLTDIQQEDLYEKNLQSGFYGGLLKPLGKGIVSRGASIVPKIIQNAGHVGGWALDMGLIATGVQDKLNFAFDNAIVNVASQADEGLRKLFPIYADAKYYNGNLLDQMFSTKFWTDDLFDGVAFAIASLAPAKFPQFAKGKYFGKVRTALGMKPTVSPTVPTGVPPVEMPTKLPNFLQTSFMTEEALINSGLPKARIESVLNTKNWLKSGAFLGYNTIGEAGFEAFDTKKQIKEELITKYNYTEEEADKIASERAADTFKINALGLLASNYAELKLLLGNKFFTSVNSDINKAKRAFLSGSITAEEAKNSLRKGFGDLGKGMLVEGFYEENFQTGVQQYEKDHIFNSPSFFETVTGTVDNMFNNVAALGKGLIGADVTPKEKEGAISIILGGIIGGGMGKISQMSYNKELKGSIDTWSKALAELKNPQHAIMTVYGNNKQQLYKKREITKEDGTKDIVFADENGNFEIDKDVLFNFAFTQSHNKEMMRQYADAVSKGDTKSADFYLNQFFVRQAFQHFNKSIFGGDVDMAAENLKYLLGEVSAEDDSDTKKDIESLVSFIDTAAQIYKNTVNEVNQKYGITPMNYGFEGYKNQVATAAIFYERTKQEWFKKQLNNYAEGTKQYEDIQKIIAESEKEVDNFLDRSKSEDIFNPGLRAQNRVSELNKELAAVDTDSKLTPEERRKKKMLLNLEYRKIIVAGDVDPISYRMMDINATNLRELSTKDISFSKQPYLNAINDVKISRDLEAQHQDTINNIQALQDKIIITDEQSGLENFDENRNQLNTLIDQLRKNLELYQKKSFLTEDDFKRYEELQNALSTIYAKLKPNEEKLDNDRDSNIEKLNDLKRELNDRYTDLENIEQEISERVYKIIKENPEEEKNKDAFFDHFKKLADLDGLNNLLQEITNDIKQTEQAIYTNGKFKELITEVNKLKEESLKQKTVDLKSKSREELGKLSIEEFEAIDNKEDIFDRIIMLDYTNLYNLLKESYDKLKESDNLKNFSVPPNSITNLINQLEGLVDMYNLSTEEVDTSDPTTVFYNTKNYTENKELVNGNRVFFKPINTIFNHVLYVDNTGTIVGSEIVSSPDLSSNFRIVFDATEDGSPIGTAKYYTNSIDNANRSFSEREYTTIKLNSPELGKMLDRNLTLDELMDNLPEVQNYVESLAKADSNYVKTILNSLSKQDRENYKRSKESALPVLEGKVAAPTISSGFNNDLLSAIPGYISTLKKEILPLSEQNYNVKENSQEQNEMLFKYLAFSQFGIAIDFNKGTYQVNDPVLYDFITKIINKDQFDNILKLASEDKVDPFSIVYYEKIVESIRNNPNALDELTNTSAVLAIDTLKSIRALKNEQVAVQLTLGSNFANQVDREYYGLAEDQIFEGYLANNPISFLNFILQRSYNDAPSDSIIERFRVNQNLSLLISDLTQEENPIELGLSDVTKKEFAEIVNQIIDINRFSTLQKNIEAQYNLNFFLTSIEKNAKESEFALSREQRIAVLELYKFLSTEPNSNNLSDYVAFLNAAAATGKTTLLKQLMSMLDVNTTNTLAISDFPSASKVVRDSIPQLKDQPVITFNDIFTEDNIKSIIEDGKREITVNGQKINLDKLNYLIIDEAAMLEHNDFDKVNKVILKLNSSRNGTKLKVVLTGDTNQLRRSGMSLRSSKLYGDQNYQVITPLTTSYRASVPIIEQIYNTYKGNSNEVKNLKGSSTGLFGEDSIGVNFINSDLASVDEDFKKQIAASSGTKLVIVSSEEAKQNYQGIDGVEVMTFREAQSLTRENVFVDINPKDLINDPRNASGSNIATNTVMYVAISRATKYALIKDYTNTSTNIVDVNLQEEIAFEQKSFKDGIVKSKTKALEILKHQLSLLEGVGIAKTENTTPDDQQQDGETPVEVNNMEDPTQVDDQNDKLVSMETEEQREEAFDNHLSMYPDLQDAYNKGDENVVNAVNMIKQAIIKNDSGNLTEEEGRTLYKLPKELRADARNLLETLNSKLPC
jgi:hypothetical protein